MKSAVEIEGAEEELQMTKEAPAPGLSYVADSVDQIVMTSEQNCLRTSNWDAENGAAQCGDIMPEPLDTPVSEPEPEPEPVVVATSTSLETYSGRALYEFDSAQLSREGQSALDGLTARLNAQDQIRAIEIVGHADSIGAEAYNQTLSEKRANSVKLYLQESLENVAVTARGMGETDPITSNDTEAGRRQNRRVEVNITAIVEQ